MSDGQQELLPVKRVDVTFVDFDQKLKIPENPLVFKARELQVVCEKYKKFLEHKPQLFNMTSYTSALNLYIDTVRQIKGEKVENGVSDERNLAGDRDESSEGTLGEGTSVGLDSRISADNPLAR